MPSPVLLEVPGTSMVAPHPGLGHASRWPAISDLTFNSLPHAGQLSVMTSTVLISLTFGLFSNGLNCGRRVHNLGVRSYGNDSEPGRIARPDLINVLYYFGVILLAV